MTLHRQPDVFREAILLTATETGLSQALVEKDYWVTWVLRNLAESPVAGEVVFKGGTSLSKAYRLIDRFSEDVDLAVLLGGRTGAAVKALIRQVHHAAVGAGTPEELPEVPGNNKLGQIRRVYHRYPRTFPHVSTVAGEDILLEITAFGEPHPVVQLPLSSYIADVFAARGLEAELDEFGLRPFAFQVLSLGRTFAEKIMALVRASYEPDPAADVSSKVRHLYDLHQLAGHPDVQALLPGEDLFVLLRAVQADDVTAGVKGPTHEWKGRPLSACWAYEQDAANLQLARRAYERELPELLHRPAPDFEEVMHTIRGIAARLVVFDQG
ncbi:nucleotidyl transferase AbiEii/AbiGii toxin family protein [Hymenobacter saemangeumensis]|uniref:Nucleotidyl transferase AbiEii/AbiGii toxin family protein n=1 Tax=Hymenobacter saemangeumensis TaxID=1084522 RepID=A0ABP8IRH4_9BACT